MKISTPVRFSISLLLMFCLLAPVTVLAVGDGKKHFNAGLKAEDAGEWDKAVEEFTLAVAENPKNADYRLHYVRALFNASQMYMKRGNALAEEKDYAGAYNAYRKAYAYDPVNELAKAQMERMLRMQELQDTPGKDQNGDGKTGVKLVPTSYQAQPQEPLPQRLEKLRDVPFPNGVDLQFLVKELAKDLDLNVLFDTASRLDNRKVKIELKNVSAAKALDYIFLQENLFFQKVGPRTIIVADANSRRQQFQQLVLRTFYLANANPEEVSKIVQGAIPMQPGRTQIVPLIDKATNSITVRDTAENIAIIGKLIKSLDKDRAEVVMDVDLYEVTKGDLLKLGNQIGSEASLSQLGVVTPGTVVGGGNFSSLTKAIPNLNPVGIASAILLPGAQFAAFQRKSASRLLASTQVHAFNNEKSTANIGQRVPVRSAQISNGLNNVGQNNGSGGFVSDVITYEQTGLKLEFEPLIFPNQDVQVKMSITSRDLAGVGVNDNPIFTEREIKGSARIQNNRTMLLASVASTKEDRGTQGLPLLGLIPILGRLFSLPTKDDRKIDIVIAVTPRVLRAPVILPEDEVERPTGSIATPTTGTLEAMIIQEEREEQLAIARRLSNTANVQLPDVKANEAPQYVKSNMPAETVQPKDSIAVSGNQTAENKTTEAQNPDAQKTAENNPLIPKTDPSILNLKPIDTSVKTLQITPTVDSNNGKVETKETSLPSEPKPETKTEPNAPKAELKLLPALPEMKASEKTKVAVLIKTAQSFRSAVLGLKFDPAKVAVRTVQYGDVFGAATAQTSVTPFLNTNGKMYVSLSGEKDTTVTSSGILAYVEIEALTPGTPQIEFDTEIATVLTVDGKTFALNY